MNSPKLKALYYHVSEHAGAFPAKEGLLFEIPNLKRSV